MKKPEEIKKGLECCRNMWVDDHWKNCDSSCPYQAEQSYCKNALHKDALALIQQLEAQVPRWISAEEQLPKEFATVIIWRNDCKNATIGWLIGGHWSVPKGVRVTHWMPLPEPPKEDEHG